MKRTGSGRVTTDQYRTLLRRYVVALVLLLGAVLGSASAAAAVAAPPGNTQTFVPAHPLGNFTVSHYNALTLTPEGIDLLSVVDIAEIPTQQEMASIDTDGDGRPSTAELSAHADTLCSEVSSDLLAQVDGQTVQWRDQDTSLQTVPGQAGLPTMRLTCRFTASAPLAEPASLTFQDRYRTDRIGWREITATGDGVRLIDSPVPARSISDELRSYPKDLLSSPLDVRSLTVSTEPGESGAQGEVADVGVPGFTGNDPFSRLVSAGDRQLDAFIGDRELTPVIGALAVVLAMLLGAGHAALPGHGKTVMAAYLAGRRGRPADALIVGATVTGTHTVGVLVLGLLLTVSSALAGEQALRWLGIISGLLIAVIGVGLLRDALRERRAKAASQPVAAVAHQHAGGGHSHTHDGEHGHGGTLVREAGEEGQLKHQHDDEHGGHGPGHQHGHSHGPGHQHGHSHGPGHQHAVGRRGLIGMGIAGGLVPSPSALVVLLGSIALGRTVFGVLLVFAYGFGMAATLTAVGLLLVRLRGRLDRYTDSSGAVSAATRAAAALPIFTAILVLVVGVGLIARGLAF